MTLLHLSPQTQLKVLNAVGYCRYFLLENGLVMPRTGCKYIGRSEKWIYFPDSPDGDFTPDYNYILSCSNENVRNLFLRVEHVLQLYVNPKLQLPPLSRFLRVGLSEKKKVIFQKFSYFILKTLHRKWLWITNPHLLLCRIPFDTNLHFYDRVQCQVFLYVAVFSLFFVCLLVFLSLLSSSVVSSYTLTVSIVLISYLS